MKVLTGDYVRIKGYRVHISKLQSPECNINDTYNQLRSDIRVHMQRHPYPPPPDYRRPWHFNNHQGRYRGHRRVWRSRSHLDDVFLPNYDKDENDEDEGDQHNKRPHLQPHFKNSHRKQILKSVGTKKTKSSDDYKHDKLIDEISTQKVSTEKLKATVNDSLVSDASCSTVKNTNSSPIANTLKCEQTDVNITQDIPETKVQSNYTNVSEEDIKPCTIVSKEDIKPILDTNVKTVLPLRKVKSLTCLCGTQKEVSCHSKYQDDSLIKQKQTWELEFPIFLKCHKDANIRITIENLKEDAKSLNKSFEKVNFLDVKRENPTCANITGKYCVESPQSKLEPTTNINSTNDIDDSFGTVKKEDAEDLAEIFSVKKRPRKLESSDSEAELTEDDSALNNSKKLKLNLKTSPLKNTDTKSEICNAESSPLPGQKSPLPEQDLPFKEYIKRVSCRKFSPSPEIMIKKPKITNRRNTYTNSCESCLVKLDREQRLEKRVNIIFGSIDVLKLKVDKEFRRKYEAKIDYKNRGNVSHRIRKRKQYDKKLQMEPFVLLERIKSSLYSSESMKLSKGVAKVNEKPIPEKQKAGCAIPKVISETDLLSHQENRETKEINDIAKESSSSKNETFTENEDIKSNAVQEENESSMVEEIQKKPSDLSSVSNIRSIIGSSKNKTLLDKQHKLPAACAATDSKNKTSISSTKEYSIFKDAVINATKNSSVQIDQLVKSKLREAKRDIVFVHFERVSALYIENPKPVKLTKVGCVENECLEIAYVEPTPELGVISEQYNESDTSLSEDDVFEEGSDRIDSKGTISLKVSSPHEQTITLDEFTFDPKKTSETATLYRADETADSSVECQAVMASLTGTTILNKDIKIDDSYTTAKNTNVSSKMECNKLKSIRISKGMAKNVSKQGEDKNSGTLENTCDAAVENILQNRTVPNFEIKILEAPDNTSKRSDSVDNTDIQNKEKTNNSTNTSLCSTLGSTVTLSLSETERQPSNGQPSYVDSNKKGKNNSLPTVINKNETVTNTKNSNDSRVANSSSETIMLSSILCDNNLPQSNHSVERIQTFDNQNVAQPYNNYGKKALNNAKNKPENTSKQILLTENSFRNPPNQEKENTAETVLPTNTTRRLPQIIPLNLRYKKTQVSVPSPVVTNAFTHHTNLQSSSVTSVSHHQNTIQGETHTNQGAHLLSLTEEQKKQLLDIFTRFVHFFIVLCTADRCYINVINQQKYYRLDFNAELTRFQYDRIKKCKMQSAQLLILLKNLNITAQTGFSSFVVELPKQVAFQLRELGDKMSEILVYFCMLSLMDTHTNEYAKIPFYKCLTAYLRSAVQRAQGRQSMQASTRSASHGQTAACQTQQPNKQAPNNLEIQNSTPSNAHQLYSNENPDNSFSFSNNRSTNTGNLQMRGAQHSVQNAAQGNQSLTDLNIAQQLPRHSSAQCALPVKTTNHTNRTIPPSLSSNLQNNGSLPHLQQLQDVRAFTSNTFASSLQSISLNTAHANPQQNVHASKSRNTPPPPFVSLTPNSKNHPNVTQMPNVPIAQANPQQNVHASKCRNTPPPPFVSLTPNAKNYASVTQMPIVPLAQANPQQNVHASNNTFASSQQNVFVNPTQTNLQQNVHASKFRNTFTPPPPNISIIPNSKNQQNVTQMPSVPSNTSLPPSGTISEKRSYQTSNYMYQNYNLHQQPLSNIRPTYFPQNSANCNHTHVGPNPQSNSTPYYPNSSMYPQQSVSLRQQPYVEPCPKPTEMQYQQSSASLQQQINKNMTQSSGANHQPNASVTQQWNGNINSNVPAPSSASQQANALIAQNWRGSAYHQQNIEPQNQTQYSSLCQPQNIPLNSNSQHSYQIQSSSRHLTGASSDIAPQNEFEYSTFPQPQNVLPNLNPQYSNQIQSSLRHVPDTEGDIMNSTVDRSARGVGTYNEIPRTSTPIQAASSTMPNPTENASSEPSSNGSSNIVSNDAPNFRIRLPYSKPMNVQQSSFTVSNHISLPTLSQTSCTSSVNQTQDSQASIGASTAVNTFEINNVRSAKENSQVNEIMDDNISTEENDLIKKEEDEIQTIDLTWVDDVDENELKHAFDLVSLKREDESSSDADLENRAVNSPADSGVSSPPIQESECVVYISKLCCCGKRAEYTCVCENAYYCGEECQHSDWDTHKQSCNFREQDRPNQ